MKKELQSVGEFHQAFDVPRRPGGFAKGLPDMSSIPQEDKALRLRLIKEEMGETIELGIIKKDDVETLDGICDSMVVLAGTADQLGLDPLSDFDKASSFLIGEMIEGIEKAFKEEDHKMLTTLIMASTIILRGIAVLRGYPYEAAFDEVHASNMSKLNKDGSYTKDEGGKIQKGEGYFQARIHKLLEDSNYRREHGNV